ncbi:MAG: HAD-IA family hydrolase [Acidobacteriia bacterium]|nr:HAD-IA family hydrolase [Terriglobia bacterium]
MKHIEAIILDFDGLILDTETPAYEAWRDIYRAHGRDLPMSQWAVCVGRGMVFDPHAHLERLLGQGLDRDEIQTQRRAEVKQRIDRQPLLPGVQEIFDQAGEMRLKIGVASSSPRAWVEGHLKARGLFNRLQALRTAEDVQETKPDPELYVSTLSALQVQAPHAIAFEDSPNGVLAAHRAGVYCVVVPNAITCQLPFDSVPIDLQVDSLLEVNLRNLCA